MVWIDIAIVVGFDDNTLMAVIQKIFQCIIKAVKRHNYSCIFILKCHRRFFEQRQHGTLPFRQVLSGCPVCTNRSQHTCQQVELIWNKRINFCKVSIISIQLLLYSIIKDDQIFYDCRFLLIQEAKGLRSSIGLFQDSFLDDSINIRRGQRQASIKASLYLRKVISFHFGDGINILLAGHDNPSFTLTLFPQLLCHGLKIQHQFRIISDILTNFIDEKYYMVIIAFPVNIRFHTLCKILNTNLIISNSSIAPIPSCLLAHVSHLD